jgi:hypothetical protein
MASTDRDALTIQGISARLATATANLAAATEAERLASLRVDEQREAVALGAAKTGDLMKAKQALARAQEAQAQAASALKVWSRQQAAESERLAAAERDERHARERQLRQAGLELAGRVAVALRDVEQELDAASRAIAEYHAEAREWAPNTQANREATWANAADAIRRLCAMYPITSATSREG